MLALFLLLQVPGSVPLPANSAPPVADAADTPAVEAPRVEPWEGSYADGLREIRRLAEAGETDAAVLIAERLIAPGSIARQVEDLTRAEGWRPRVGRALESVADRLELLGPPPAVRAEAQFARGVALDLAARAAQDEAERALRREQARLAFESARLLAGPGALRLDATYAQGWIALAAAEEQRAKIPEISGQPVPPPAAAPVPDPAGAPKPPDALALARAAYLGARERFIERLRLAWRDPDTQANVELIQRRLRELDEIEQKRKQEQEQQKQDEKQDPKQDEKQDPNQDKSKDPQKSEEPKPQDPGEDKQEPDPKESEPKPDPKDEKTEPKPADAQNVQAMSKEEMMQLLERLERIEEVQRELQEKLKRMRRAAVEKDW